jgi:hypothetical protein
LHFPQKNENGQNWLNEHRPASRVGYGYSYSLRLKPKGNFNKLMKYAFLPYSYRSPVGCGFAKDACVKERVGRPIGWLTVSISLMRKSS